MKHFSAFCAIAIAATINAAAAERAPLFKEVAAPHPYYWREMYVPQLTSGPSSLAWSRDGKALYFSMQGRIWRQGLDKSSAEEITDGAGYDYQPDPSPDGRSLVYSRREKDAIDLVVLDLKSREETIVARNGALNLDARWSPNGTKIAYVTTADSGNFHIAIAEQDGKAWRSLRWRPERKTTKARYYYSQTDHELSPAWSPDGTELLFVANPDILHGTGSIFRQKLDLSEAAILVREEETNWKAHPDWSPDGARILYSSYLGRQWHQLWMTTAEGGGYPIPVTYGDFDRTNARWSPDGRKIAAVTNEAGGLAIEIVDVIGGARAKLQTNAKKVRDEIMTVKTAIRDAEGDPVSARVEVRAGDGRDYAPGGALVHADDAVAPGDSTETHYFHSGGDDVTEAPRGPAEARVWRGLSSVPATMTVDGRGETEIGLLDLDPAGVFENWKGGDVHVHMNYGGAYRMEIGGLARQADAEALDLVFNLIVNKEQRIPDIAEFSPTPARPAGADAVIAQGQEFHTSVWGHLGLLGLEDHLLIPDYAGYASTAVASLFPDNATIAELAHRQNALVGYVHPFDPPAPDPVKDAKLTYALPADVALGLVDYMEIVGFSDHRTTESVWRRLLNCGFRIPAAGGTDAMTNFASLRGPVGVNRTYVDMGPSPPSDPAAFTRAWLDGLKAGKSFATNSALLSLAVEGRGPGDEIRLKKAGRLKFSARMASIAAMDSLDLVVNGEVVKTLPLSKEGRESVLEGEIEITGSSWISMRASSKESSPDVFDLYPFAVTSPIFVTVRGKPQRSREDADYFIAWIDRLIAFARDDAPFNTDAERKRVLDTFAKARREFERRR